MHWLDQASDDRLPNGARKRRDGAGDAWANAHRDALGRGYQMHDVDAAFGFEAFGINGGDRLFIEHEPDNYRNRENIIRRFATVAMFDRKASVGAARSSRNALSTAFYLHLCRSLGLDQPKPIRFFFVCGSGPEWTLLEINPKTGEECGQPTSVTAATFRQVWDSIGLSALRLELRSWVTA